MSGRLGQFAPERSSNSMAAPPANTAGRRVGSKSDARIDHAEDDRLRRALADGAPAAVAAAITRIRQEEAAALARLRATVQP
ncbi:hypothetical protein QFZ27_001577 [Inquilinus ginsengisoli]|uniref:hypothetical protein n=1 Tax=Inquilinus ginsengisoli TaxID=363840 RepID=UPI003D1D723F